jgi:hypothetical protein
MLEGEHGILKTHLHPDTVANTFRTIAKVRVEGRLLRIKYNQRKFTIYVSQTWNIYWMFSWPKGADVPANTRCV